MRRIKPIPRGTRSRKAIHAAIALVAVVLGSPFSTAAADTFDVTTLNDSGPGSFRAAFDAAIANPGADLVVFNGSLTGTIDVLSPLPAITPPTGNMTKIRCDANVTID